MHDKYIQGRMHGVQGYLSQVDAHMFSVLMAAQTKDEVKGALAEIGIFFGRSYYLMGLHRQPGEALYGADIFIEDHLSKSGSHFDDFMQGAERLGIAIDADTMFR